MSGERWVQPGFEPDFELLPPGERAAREEMRRAQNAPVNWQITELFSESDMEMLRFKTTTKEWISAGYGTLRILRFVDSATGTTNKSIVLEQFTGAKPILNRKITYQVKVTPYPVKTAVEVIFPDDLLAFRKRTPFVDPSSSKSTAVNEQDVKSAPAEDNDDDDVMIVSEMIDELNMKEDGANTNTLARGSDLHLKGLAAWRLLEVLRDKTDAVQLSFRGVLYPFRATNIMLWRFKDASAGWQQFGDGELAIAAVSGKFFIKWTRRYDQKVMVHALLEPQNTQYALGAIPVHRGVIFTIVRAPQDGEAWTVMFQCRGSKAIDQLYKEREGDTSEGEEKSIDTSSASDIDDAMMVTTTVSGNTDESIMSLEKTIDVDDNDYRRMIHWAFLKALARTPARPKRVRASTTKKGGETNTTSAPDSPGSDSSSNVMDTS